MDLDSDKEVKNLEKKPSVESVLWKRRLRSLVQVSKASKIQF